MFNAERFANRPAIREKDLGIWQTWTWREMKEEVFACFYEFATLRFKRGDKLAIVGNNRPRLYWGIAAAQCLGGIPVPLYADSVVLEMQYVFEHVETKFVLAEDQEQIDKVLKIMDNGIVLKHVIFDDDRGLGNYERAPLHDFAVVQQLGHQFAQENPRFLENKIAKNAGSDVSIFLYTSSTNDCGRNNRRIVGWMGRADQTAKMRGMFIHPEQIDNIKKRHPEMIKARLLIDEHDHNDRMTLPCETTTPSAALKQAIKKSVKALCKVRGEVTLLSPNTITNDGLVIEDIRQYQ